MSIKAELDDSCKETNDVHIGIVVQTPELADICLLTIVCCDEFDPRGVPDALGAPIHKNSHFRGWGQFQTAGIFVEPKGIVGAELHFDQLPTNLFHKVVSS